MRISISSPKRSERSLDTLQNNKVTNLKYVGIEITRIPSGSLYLRMPQIIQEIVTEADGEASTPATQSLFQKLGDQTPLTKADKERFHTRVAKLLYLALLCRPDVLLPTAILTRVVTNPNQYDLLTPTYSKLSWKFT